uniref:HDC16673 n=1 Tax=Drosophila melanogaster TaxID=7227 RepID=Q6IIX1_DROME|nr:TPA_inf: HDC16673 [Drosophila melanogaster]
MMHIETSHAINQSYHVSPTPTLPAISGDDITTVLLVNNESGHMGDFHGRFLTVRPEIGVLKSTARTFIQDGITTEFATKIVGTTLNNGRLYAQYLKKSSRVLYENENISPSVVTSWDIDDSIGAHQREFVGNTDFVNEQNTKNKVLEAPALQDKKTISYMGSDSNDTLRTDFKKEDEINRLIEVLSIKHLETYTVKMPFELDIIVTHETFTKSRGEFVSTYSIDDDIDETTVQDLGDYEGTTENEYESEEEEYESHSLVEEKIDKVVNMAYGMSVNSSMLRDSSPASFINQNLLDDQSSQSSRRLFGRPRIQSSYRPTQSTTFATESSSEDSVEEDTSPDEESDVEEGIKNNNNSPLLRFRRPINAPSGFSPPIRQTGNSPVVSLRRNPLSPRAKISTTTSSTTTTTAKPRARSFQRPIGPHPRSRPQNTLFPPRGLFQTQIKNENLKVHQLYTQALIAESPTATNHRSIRPSRPTTKRPQFTLREKDANLKGTASKNFRRQPASGNSRRPVGNSGNSNSRRLKSYLLLGNLNLPAHPLIGAVGQQNVPSTIIPTSVEPITEYRTHTSTYVTTIFDGKSTILPVTFQGKKILTTVYDTTAQTITATEYSVDTIINTLPSVQSVHTVGPAAHVNNLLLQQLLIQQQHESLVQAISNPTPPQVLLSENLQVLDDGTRTSIKSDAIDIEYDSDLVSNL